MRLRRRLAITFMIVIAVGSGSTLFFVRIAAENLLRSFVYTGDADKAKAYASILSDYYGTKGSWDGLQAFLSDIPALLSAKLDENIHGTRGAPAQAPAHVAAPTTFPADTVSALMADRIAVADIDGVIVADTSGALLGTVHPDAHVAHGVPILVGPERRGTVLVGSMVDSSLSGLNETFLSSIMTALFWATALSAAIALALGLVFSARVTRPLADLDSAVRKVSSGDLAAAVAVDGRDEISELSRSFNAMTEELKRLEEAKRRIIADSAHELRTPVTLIRGTVEAMIDGVYPLDIPTLMSVHEETVRLSRLIDMLRELESIDSGSLVLSLDRVDAAQAARKAVALFDTAAKARGIALSLADPGEPPVAIRADPVRLGEVVYNLLANAIKYTPEGGVVELRIVGRNAAGMAELRVDDSGPGIPPEHRDRIFERFYRIGTARDAEGGGRGLGLAIASEIVKAHGGELSVADSDLGGARFIVALPRA